MNEKDAKNVRSMVRDIVAKELPKILTEQLIQSALKQADARIDDRLDRIKKHMETVLKSIEERTKELQSFVTRVAVKVPEILKGGKDE